MKAMYSKEERFIRAQKRVKEIIGFYTHLIVSVFIIPFIIFINLNGSPQFHWFWIFIAAWTLGLVIHWINTFGFSKMTLKKDWETKKIREIMGEENYNEEREEKTDYAQEMVYVNAKKRVKEIRGFYAHLVVTLISIPLIVWVNLQFVPDFYFFWYAAGGMALAIFFHWLGVFGFAKLGLGKDWEQRKIKELMESGEF